MLEESLGLGERRATTIVTIILFAQAIWVFLFQYLPLDAGLWTLQADLVYHHLFGAPHFDAWQLIHFPASNVAAPFIAGILSSFLSPELVVRLMLTVGAILLRGSASSWCFEILRVRDIGNLSSYSRADS